MEILIRAHEVSYKRFEHFSVFASSKKQIKLQEKMEQALRLAKSVTKVKKRFQASSVPNP